MFCIVMTSVQISFINYVIHNLAFLTMWPSKLSRILVIQHNVSFPSFFQRERERERERGGGGI